MQKHTQGEPLDGSGGDGLGGRVDGVAGSRLSSDTAEMIGRLLTSGDKAFDRKHFKDDERGRGSSSLYREAATLMGVNPEQVPYFSANRYGAGDYSGVNLRVNDEYRRALGRVAASVPSEHRAGCAHALGRYGQGLYNGRRYFQATAVMEAAMLLDPSNVQNLLWFGDMLRTPKLNKRETHTREGSQRNALLGFEVSDMALHALGLSDENITGIRPVRDDRRVDERLLTQGVWAANNAGFFAYRRGRHERYFHHDDAAETWLALAADRYMLGVELAGFPRDLRGVSVSGREQAIDVMRGAVASTRADFDYGKRVNSLLISLCGLGGTRVQQGARGLEDKSKTRWVDESRRTDTLRCFNLALAIDPQNKPAREQLEWIGDTSAEEMTRALTSQEPVQAPAVPRPDASQVVDVRKEAESPAALAREAVKPRADERDFYEVREQYGSMNVSGLTRNLPSGFQLVESEDVRDAAGELVKDLVCLRDNRDTARSYFQSMLGEIVPGYWQMGEVDPEDFPLLVKDWVAADTIAKSKAFPRRVREAADAAANQYETIAGLNVDELIRPQETTIQTRTLPTKPTDGDKMLIAYHTIAAEVMK